MISNSTKDNQNPTPADEYTAGSQSCQEKTLVNIDTINEIYNKIEIYPNCIILKPSEQYKTKSFGNHAPRGTITEFTKRSRFRLFVTLAKISNHLDFPPIFATLTYHHGHENTPKPNHSVMHNFLVQLREFDPDVQFIWRKEYQKRGAPHYHLIIFPSGQCPFSGKKDYNIKINLIWHNLADPKSRRHAEYGCLIKNINNYKQACFYLSKYVAKCNNEGPDIQEGKHWGCSRNLPFKLINVIKLNERGYSHTIETIRKWLLSKGKQLQADSDYLNIFNEQIIFISELEFIKIITEETTIQLHH